MGRSMHHICERLHEQYGRLPTSFIVPKRLTKAGTGDIIRIGPNRVRYVWITFLVRKATKPF